MDPNQPIKHRIRIRFRKEGDLRLIGHLDLMRAFERLFRRADLQLRMTEGFHPKPRMHFAAALSLGIEGVNEVAEIELNEPAKADELLESLRRHTSPGLHISSVEVVPPEARKLKVTSATYEIDTPQERSSELASAISDLLAADPCMVERGRNKSPVNLHESLNELTLRDGVLFIHLQLIDGPSAGPREVLRALNIADLEKDGFILRRTDVGVAP